MRSIPALSKYAHRFGALACLCAAFAPAPARAITQEEAQHAAANTNRRGSDDDQDEAVRNAMMALMNLAALNIPGAFAKGYEAYGNYINSEKLDDLEARTKRLRGLMGSVDGQEMLRRYRDAQATAAGKDSGVSGKVATTLSRLDTGFLYKGQTAAVAEEFEKRSGMKREELFRHLAAATDAHYTYDDPDLLGKLEQRWRAFKERVPNKEFRDNLEKAEGMFPHDMRVKMLGEAMAFYKNAWKGDGSRVAAAPTTIPPAAEAAAAAAPAVVAAGPAGEEQRAPAAAAADGFYPKKVGLYIGLDRGQDPLKELFQNANASTDENSIFKMVSLHYRKLAPALVAQKNVRDAK